MVIESEPQHIGTMSARRKRQAALLIGIAGGQQQQLLQLQLRKRGVGKPKMAVMHRVERTTEKSDRSQIAELLADLSTTEHDPFLRCKPFKSDRPTRVEFVGRDTDFGT